MSDQETLQAVSHALLDNEQAALADWYAAPMVVRQAEAMQVVAQRAIQHSLRTGTCGYQARVLAMICHWWLRPELQPEYEELQQIAGSIHQRALVQLVYGQLLASRKLEPARDQLGLGFRLAAALLTSAEYFRLLRRHEMLGMLTYGRTPAVAQDLPALLAEAAVIERLRRGNRTEFAARHTDTLG
jgi:hypothetical protein